jgi:hypothetical protein
MVSRLISISLAKHVRPPKERAITDWEAECSRIQDECDRTKELLASTEEAAAIALERQIASASERVRADFTMERDKLREEFAAERERLLQSLQKAETALRNQTASPATASGQGSARSESLEEFAQRKVEIEQLRSENGRLQSERSELERRLLSVQSDLNRTRQEMNGKAANGDDKARTILKEAARIEARIRGMQEMATDPEADLSEVVRTSVERAQMESYLDGLRFAIDGSAQFQNGVHHADAE